VVKDGSTDKQAKFILLVLKQFVKHRPSKPHSPEVRNKEKTNDSTTSKRHEDSKKQKAS
jgi:hypothetical protein